MKISLSRDDIQQAASQIKQIKRINSLEFIDNTIVCRVTLDKKAIGILAIPENWKISFNFTHTSETVTITLKITSDTDVSGNLKLVKVINTLSQKLLNSIINLISLEGKLLSKIKLPDFVSANGKSITVDLKQLLQDKLNCDININALNFSSDSIAFDFSFEFQE